MDAIFCFIWSKFDKTNENYLVENNRPVELYWEHNWCHWTSISKKCLFCFILDKSNKTNRWPYHKHFCTCFHFRRYVV